MDSAIELPSLYPHQEKMRDDARAALVHQRRINLSAAPGNDIVSASTEAPIHRETQAKVPDPLQRGVGATVREAASVWDEAIYLFVRRQK